MSVAGAGSVNILQPFNGTVTNGGSAFLGKVGPGQTFYVTISSSATSATGTLLNLGWNELLAANVPSHWVVQNSSLYNTQLSIEITTAPNSANGIYAFNLTAVNVGNYSKLGAVNFQVLVNVTPDVFKLSISPTNVSTGPGQPAGILVTINNTGVSDSPFVITAHGLPAWNLTQEVIALHHTSQTYTYPIYENEPQVYHVQLNVSSSQSPLVRKVSDLTLVVKPSVLNDYKAVGQGEITFPIILEPVYAIMYLISKLLGV